MKNQKIERILNELNIELRYFNEFSEIGLKISEFRELSDNEESRVTHYLPERGLHPHR